MFVAVAVVFILIFATFPTVMHEVVKVDFDPPDEGQNGLNANIKRHFIYIISIKY